MYPIPPNEHLVENRNCKKCSSVFPITDKDMDFYTKISPTFNGKIYQIPPPTLCPDCRQQRRLAFRNERKLYKRKCDATGKDIISCFSPEKQAPVYDLEYWWSDHWDQMSYGKEASFSLSFIHQFRGIYEHIPKRALMQGTSNENSAFSNCVGECENVYMVFASMWTRNAYYSDRISKSEDCVDCTNNPESGHCYEINIGSHNFLCLYSHEIYNCSDCIGCFRCDGCHDCIGCSNLTNARYRIWNIQYSEEEYMRIKEEFSTNGYRKEDFQHEWQKSIRPHLNIVGSEGCIGDDIVNSKNVFMGFTAKDSENIRYALYTYGGCQDVMDTFACINTSTRVYESAVINKQSDIIVFSYDCWGGCNRLYYCIECKACSDCFGCTGLRNKQYCILNKQYTKEKYEELVPRIIEHMSSPQPSPEGENILGIDSSSLKERAIGGEVEWGEFFPASMSPFGYNETVANEYYPLSREEVLGETSFGKEVPRYEAEDFQKGNRENPQSLRDSSFQKGALFNWSDYEAPFPTVEKIIPASKLPDTIEGIPNDILTWAIECEVSGRPFRIIKQELEFYRKHNLPIPRRHPDVRHMDRMKMRNPRKLFERFCDCPNCEVNWKKKGVILREGMDAGYFLLEEKIQGDSGTERRNPPSITTETGDGHLLSKGGLRKKMITTYSPERPETVYCEVCYEREVIS